MGHFVAEEDGNKQTHKQDTCFISIEVHPMSSMISTPISALFFKGSSDITYYLPKTRHRPIHSFKYYRIVSRVTPSNMGGQGIIELKF